MEPDGVRRTAMDEGPEKTRTGSNAVPAPETLVFKLNATDASTLQTFYAENKALRFDYAHPIWGTVVCSFDGPIRWSERKPWRIATVRLKVYR